MLKLISLAATISMFCMAHAVAQQRNAIYTQTRPISCAGANNLPGGSSIIFPENFIDQTLPTQLQIVGSTIWIEGFNGGSTGNLAFGVDRNMTYINTGGFPQTQRFFPATLKQLALMVFGPGSSLFKQTFFNDVPIVYNVGQDAITVAPECASGLTISPFLILDVSMLGDIETLPTATQLLSVVNNGEASSYQTGRSVRNFVPGPSSATTKIRARISLPCLVQDSCTQLKAIYNHLSACVQLGNTPNCASAPVELKVGLLSGYPLTAGAGTFIWTDWTPLAVLPGQNILIHSSFFNPGNVGNAWAYSSGAGLGVWVADPDSWNSAVMTGTASYYPGVTSGIDKVQVQ